MANVRGEVKIVNKTGITKLNNKFKRSGTLDAEDFDEVGYKKIDITGHKPTVKKRW